MGPFLSREFVTGPCTRSSRNVPHYYFKVTDASILSHILVKLLKGSRLTIKSIQSDIDAAAPGGTAKPRRNRATLTPNMKRVKVVRVVGAGCVLNDDDELFSMDGPCGQHGNESTLFAVVKQEE